MSPKPKNNKSPKRPKSNGKSKMAPTRSAPRVGPGPATLERPVIRVRGARQNNLKGFDVEIPHEALTVVTGVSGSGKSSLAFQTLYAEGQRRYSESFSAYVRQFLERLPRPQADEIEGMLPAIAIEQQAGMGGGRSTVATMTDLADYLKLLYARAGVLHCPDCGELVPEASAVGLRDRLLAAHHGHRALVAFPVTLALGDDGEAEAERYRQLGELRALGFTRHLRLGDWDGAAGPLPGTPEVAELDASALEVAEEALRTARAGLSKREKAGKGKGRAKAKAAKGRRTAKGRKATTAARKVRGQAVDVAAAHGQSVGDDLPAARLWILVDRLRVEPARAERLLEAVEQALRHGDGPLAVLVERATDAPGAGGAYAAHRHAPGLRCQSCGRTFDPPTTNLFSYNTPVGACDRCGGFGRVMDIDWDLVIPDGRKSLAEGAIRPWTTPKTAWEREHLEGLCEGAGIPMDVPWKDLSAAAQHLILQGDEDEDVWGVKGWFDWLETRTYRTHVRIFLSRYRAYRTCPDCDGARLKPEALAYRVGGLHLGAIYRMTIDEARAFFDDLALPAAPSRALGPVLGEIRARLRYLEEVGVGYLTLDRPARTLSGGESQRVTLTTALGASLVQTLFVLDEPTVGLHPRDTDRLVGILGRLVEHGNTVVVVEHDPDVIRAADHLVDLGPGAGEAGGELLFSGPPADLLGPRGKASGAQARSLTAALVGRPGRVLEAPPPRRGGGGGGAGAGKGAGKGKGEAKALWIRDATAHNLQGLDVAIPLGTLTCVTGVSGSGKSTLVEHVLHRGLARKLGQPVETPGAHRALEGWEALRDVIYVDQSPAASSPRATPLTYVGIFDRIRTLYAGTEEAALRSLGPGTFSWNTAGGRCEACEGTGHVRVELHFLPDALVPCEVCEGRRFTDEVLGVTWRGQSIHDVLSMTVTEAVAFFEGEARVLRGLRVLEEVGLGYLRLGQGLHTLSGGEAQRLKVARHLALEKTTGSLFLLDEPTRGLHLADVGVLVSALHRLVDRGNTVVVVEHHPEVMWQADHLIDLGPEGGVEGGHLVAAGPPEAIAAAPGSHTGRFLAAYLAGEAGPVRAATTARRAGRPGVAARAADIAAGGKGAQISLRGAREHNLQDLDLDLPRDRLVVLTGPSGSGKSSVAFDILHAEGQRRFLDCLSPYARQYMQQLSRPEIGALQGLPPTIAVEQRLTRGRRMSTVATVTEIFPYLRLLFAKVGRQRCPHCGTLTETATPAELLEELLRRYAGQPVRLLAPVIRQKKGWHQTVLGRARRLGLTEVRVDGKLRPLAGKGAPDKLARYRLHDVDFVLAHEPLRPREADRWRTLVGQALDLGRGHFAVLSDEALARAGAGGEDVFGTSRTCRACRLAFPPPDPRLFSFTSAQGACPACEGAGVDEEGGRCDACGGGRLRPEALHVELDGQSLAAVHGMRPAAAQRFLEGLALGGHLGAVVEPLRRELVTRLGFLETVGLSYLTLDRSAATLSGGELQRLRLASHLSAPLHGVLYILDEPTIGLHPEDHAQLLDVLLGLRRAQNTVLIVEHDEETMRAADHIIDLGPGGGRAGGRLVDEGSPEAITRLGTGLTAQLLRGEVGNGHQPAAAPLAPASWITLAGAHAHNLRDVAVRLPTGGLTVITGRSGSGKSTLLEDVLLATAAAGRPTGCRDATGLAAFDRVVQVDQQPIGRNPRSCPATYVGLMARLRERFAQLPEARLRGFGPGRFSFNVAGGRCPECDGHGLLTVEMGFLPDAHVPCPRCGGRRFHRDTLAIRLRGQSIADVLEMSMAEAAEFFAHDKRLHRALSLFVDIGLDYMPLGQPSPTLSGGEAQRVKLVEELAKSTRGQTLYLLDEPTTGLHGADVDKLVAVLGRLVERGHTVVLIEHHLAVMSAADWIVDLGPGAGPDGGSVLYQGPPGPLAAEADRRPESATAAWLARYAAGR